MAPRPISRGWLAREASRSSRTSARSVRSSSWSSRKASRAGGVGGANRSSVNGGGFLVTLGGGFFGSGTGGAQPRWSRATRLKVP